MWIIVQTFQQSEYPYVVGTFKNRDDAIEEILKLCVYDCLEVLDLDDTGDSEKEEKIKEIVKSVKSHRELLKNGEYTTYSESNIYTLVECPPSLRSDFDNEVEDLYKKTL